MCVTDVGQGVVAVGVSGGIAAGAVQMSDEEVGVDVVSGVGGMSGASQTSDVSCLFAVVLFVVRSRSCCPLFVS